MEIYLIIGVLLYFATVLDLLQTTLSMQGGGWLTSRLSHYLWKVMLYLSGKDGRSRFLAHAGYILLVFILLTWIILLWTSQVLIFYSEPGAIVNSTTKVPAGFWELSYYSGYTLSTLGMGDFIASENIWRIITSIYSFTGLVLLTMSVTYIAPVLSAVIDQRKLGLSLSTLGSTPQEIVVNSWNGKNFDSLTEKIDELSDAIIRYSQQHRAYPVIHYFHNNKEKNAVILQLARLYEALLIISERIKEDIRPRDTKLKPLVVAYDNYFEVIDEVTHISMVEDGPETTSIQKLLEEGLIMNNTQSHSFTEQVNRNRRFFKTLVQQDGWSWSLVDAKKS